MVMTLAERAAATRKSLLKNNNTPNFYLSRLIKDDEVVTSEIQTQPLPAKSPEACNPKWNAEDQALIDWVQQNWDDAFFANAKEARERFGYEIAQGADGENAKTGLLQNALRFLKEEFEKFNYQRKDAQISTDTHDINDDNTTNLSSDTSFNVERIVTWSYEEQALINWFTELRPDQLPATPFMLAPGMKVMGSKFYDQLRLSIEAGAYSARARTGALQHDLQKLKLLVG